MAIVTICNDFGVQKNKVFHCFHIYHEVMGLDAMILVFFNVEFKPAFSLSSFTFIKRLFCSPFSAISMVLSVYLRLLILLPAILIPACSSYSPAFHMMYSSYKLNKQGDNIQTWHIPFPIWNQSIVPCLVLTVAFWPAYRFLRRQVRWSGIPIFLRIHCIKLLQLCLTLCNSIDCSPPGSSVHGILQTRIHGVGFHALLPYIHYHVWNR